MQLRCLFWEPVPVYFDPSLGERKAMGRRQTQDLLVRGAHAVPRPGSQHLGKAQEIRLLRDRFQRQQPLFSRGKGEEARSVKIIQTAVTLLITRQEQ